jgi:hypothetical protein
MAAFDKKATLITLAQVMGNEEDPEGNGSFYGIRNTD